MGLIEDEDLVEDKQQDCRPLRLYKKFNYKRDAHTPIGAFELRWIETWVKAMNLHQTRLASWRNASSWAS